MTREQLERRLAMAQKGVELARQSAADAINVAARLEHERHAAEAEAKVAAILAQLQASNPRPSH